MVIENSKIGFVGRMAAGLATASMPVKLTLLVILMAYLAVLCSGLTAREPMVADEVVHYYMLVTQADKLPGPNVDVNIPMQGWTYHRFYPHVFLWHYLGAIIWLAFGKAFWVVQAYHSLYWLQLLVSCFLLARLLWPDKPKTVLLFVVALASLPMLQLFSVLFFQDIPATAQLTTAFLFLRERKLWPALLFMGIAMSMKVTVFAILPAFLFCVWLFFHVQDGWRRVAMRLAISVVVLAALCAPMAIALTKMGWNYYPLTTLQQYSGMMGFSKTVESLWTRAPAPVIPAVLPESAGVVKQTPPVRQAEKPEISNNPGDLRVPINWAIYFGGVFWLVIGCGLVAIVLRLVMQDPVSLEWWPSVVGIWYVAITAFHMREAPDARFFMPAVPFLLMGLSGGASVLLSRRIWLPLVMAAAIVQSAVVLAKTVSLRRISPPMWAAIEFLRTANPANESYLMYPEGHERFLPGTTDWYMGMELRDFWRADNNKRMQMLERFKIKLIVVKKNKIRDVPHDSPDLSAYPASFVADISKDSRFERIFENQAVIVFRVAPQAKSGALNGRSGE